MIKGRCIYAPTFFVCNNVVIEIKQSNFILHICLIKNHELISAHVSSLIKNFKQYVIICNI